MITKSVIFTLEVSKSLLNIYDYKNYVIVNCYEILNKNNYDILNDTNEKRIEYIANEINNSKNDILICDTSFSLADFLKISELLNSSKLTINKILVPNDSKRKLKLEEWHEIYENHNRWLDINPKKI